MEGNQEVTIFVAAMDHFITFISHARKPQAFKLGDEYSILSDAKRRPFPACLAWPKVMKGMPED